MNMDVKSKERMETYGEESNMLSFHCNATIPETEMTPSQCFILKQVKTITL